MKKDKKWLKEEINSELMVYSGNSIMSSYYYGRVSGLNCAFKLINELDEPDQDIDLAYDLLQENTTLSQEDFDLYWNCINDGVAVRELKQKKVVVNGVMAGHIENCKNLKLTLSDSLNLVVSGDKQEELLFARAWLDGYTVEKEKLYKVLLPGVESIDRQMCMHEETKVISFADDGYNSRKYSKDDEFIRLFTEQEIREIDERYFAFAEEVTK